MKLHRILFLIAAMVVPQLALAKLPMKNDVFGKSEGTLDFCAQANAKDASKYQERKKSLVKGVPEAEVAEARTTKEYKGGYDWITTELGKVPKDQVIEACTAALQGDK